MVELSEVTWLENDRRGRPRELPMGTSSEKTPLGRILRPQGNLPQGHGTSGSHGTTFCTTTIVRKPIGSSLGRPRLSFSSPFTGYLPISRQFIFMGNAFNNYISYNSLLFSDMLCSTPSSLSR
jgi:hypothetical protein